MNENDDPYDILGVAKDATAAEIKKSYRKLALKYHPDKQTTDEARETATAQFAKISAAYEILSDDEERHQYDLRKKYGGGPNVRYTTTSKPSYNTTHTAPPNSSYSPSSSPQQQPQRRTYSTTSTSSPGTPGTKKRYYTTYTSPPSSSKSPRSTTSRTSTTSTFSSPDGGTYTFTRTTNGPSKGGTYTSTRTFQDPFVMFNEVFGKDFDVDSFPADGTTTFTMNGMPTSDIGSMMDRIDLNDDSGKRNTIQIIRSGSDDSTKMPESPTTKIKSKTIKKKTVTPTTQSSSTKSSISSTPISPQPTVKSKVIKKEKTNNDPELLTTRMSMPSRSIRRQNNSSSSDIPEGVVSMSSSTRIVCHPDGTHETITETTYTYTDGSMSMQKKSSRAASSSTNPRTTSTKRSSSSTTSKPQLPYRLVTTVSN